MNTPTLIDLPAPPVSKIGWPWIETTQFCNLLSNQETLPRISIITPSYNQGNFIEKTIRSVLLQGYSNLEYIIIDAGSTDNTVEIIKRYEPWITYWVSEPDRGQTHAINKGLAVATGDILAYLNSDDYYLPGTLFKVADYFQQFPQTDLLHGQCRYVNEQGEKIGEQFGNIQTLEEILDLWGVWWQKRQFVQPEVFWTKQISHKIGYFNEDLYFVMDYEYWMRILKAGGIIGRIDTELSCFRFTSVQKSQQSEKVAQELMKVLEPVIWDYSIKLSIKKRLFLQGQWLYDVAFLKQVETSVSEREHKYLRYMKSLQIIFSYPQILFSSGLWNRLRNWLIAKYPHNLT